jgi:Ca-activated chloride channel family protein
VPLVVGPRYQPHGAGKPPENTVNNTLGNEKGIASSDTTESFGKWELEALLKYPAVAGVDLPKSIESERVSLAVSLHGGMPINAVYSDTHSISTKKVTLEDWDITLSKGRVIDNRDFVLRYVLSGTQSQAGLLAHKDERGGFFSLLIEPPAVPASEDITLREMVFVLDCSGSMNGLPMDASKAFMREALNHLRPSDSFRIIRFSDAATEFSSQPLPASAANVDAGLKYTEQLYGSGGTEMLSGIRQALAPAVPNDAMRIVVFLTDGYIGNEASILSYINKNLGDTRIYAFGVGTSVNRYLLTEVARVGRGFVRYMDPTESIDEVAKTLAGRLQSPVLTDISIDWGRLSPTQVNPDPIPDLFAGQSIRLMGRYAQAGNHVIRVHGKVNGRPATLPLQVSLPETSNDGEAIALVWARSKIKHLMDEFLMPESRRLSGMHDDHLKQTITDIGLDFSLVTKWTAFVAVTERIYNSAPETTKQTQVPLPMVKGVTKKAYGNISSSSHTQAFHGNSAPEPNVYISMVLLSLMFGVWLYKTRRISKRFQA